jgi:hypothetical protein
MWISCRPLVDSLFYVSLQRISSSAMTVERNLAEIDPEKFAAILCDKLHGVEGPGISRRLQLLRTTQANVQVCFYLQSIGLHDTSKQCLFYHYADYVCG